MEAPQTATRHLLRFLHRPADLGAGKCRHGEEKIKRQKQEKVEVGGENRGGEQLQKRDHRGEQEIAIGLRAQDLHYCQEKNQVYRGFQKSMREEQIIQRKKACIGQGGGSEEAVRDLETHKVQDQQRAQQQSGGGQPQRSRIQIAGARNG